MEAIKYQKTQWIDIIHPHDEDLEYLQKKFKFHELDLEDCVSETERPKIDQYKEYVFMVLHFPVYNKRQNRFMVAELNIFLGKNFLVTLHDEILPPHVEFREKLKESLKLRKQYLAKGTAYLLYELISEIFDYCFPLIDKVNANIRAIEKEMFDTDRVRNLLKDILIVKRNIITLRRIILPQRPVIAALEHKGNKFTSSDLEVYFDDVVDKIEKLWSNLETEKEVIEALQDTNESIISHNTNDIVRILTFFSAIMLPLTFITGVYGMNILLPFMQSTHAFWYIVGMMILVVACMLGIFKWNKWI